MKYLFFFFTVCGFKLIHAQSISSIEKIKTIKQANAFVKQNPGMEAEVTEMNSGTDSSVTAKLLTTTKAGDHMNSEGYTYKVLEIRKSNLIRMSYIFFDISKFSKSQIDSLRTLVITMFKTGTPFTELAKAYNMDGNPNPDMGWIAEGMLVKDFSKAVLRHKSGEIFTVDAKEKKWYYVVLKTHEQLPVSIYSLLKIKQTTK